MNKTTQWEEVGGSDIHDFKMNPELVGKYTKVEPNQGPKKNSNLYTVENEFGEEMKFWGGAVIDSRFENIALGEMVKIVYEGKQKSKAGTEYNAFKVYHEAQQESVPSINPDEVNAKAQIIAEEDKQN